MCYCYYYYYYYYHYHYSIIIIFIVPLLSTIISSSISIFTISNKNSYQSGSPANCEMRGLILCAHRHFSDVPGTEHWVDTSI